MTQITVTAEGSYPAHHHLPEDLVLGLLAEIQKHMEAYGMSGIQVCVSQQEIETAEKEIDK